jgi:hypothetical protein
MLLPEVAADPAWTDFRLATIDAPTPQVVGAVASTPVVERDGTVGTRLVMRVARPFRRRGLGREIIAAAATQLQTRGQRLLVVANPTEVPEARPFLESCRFTLIERMRSFEADYASSRARLLAPCARLEARGGVPPGVRIVPLPEAPIDPLVALHVALIGGTTAGITAMLKARIAARSRDDSHVLLVDGSPFGLMLFATRNGLGRIDSKVVSPQLQAAGLAGGWPDLLLMAEGFRSSDRHPPRVFRFECRESNRPMMRLARHLNADTIETSEIFARSAS